MARTTAKTAKKERQGFQPGKSGNPKGRPHGSRNKATLAVEALLDGQAEALTQVAIQSALEGDLLGSAFPGRIRETDASPFSLHLYPFLRPA